MKWVNGHLMAFLFENYLLLCILIYDPHSKQLVRIIPSTYPQYGSKYLTCGRAKAQINAIYTESPTNEHRISNQCTQQSLFRNHS